MDTTSARQFVNKNPLAFMATCDGTTPHVRGMMRVMWDERGLLFSTGTSKAIHAQLLANPAVELCFFDTTTNAQLRIAGRAKLVDDQQIKEEVLEVFTFLKPLVEKKGYEMVAPFYIVDAKATRWDMSQGQQPPQWFELEL